MPDYKSMYLQLFNQVSDAIALLQEAQRQSEEAYLVDFPVQQNGADAPE